MKLNGNFLLSIMELERELPGRHEEENVMKTIVKTVAGRLFFPLLLTCLMAGTVFAAAEKINTVKLTFSCDPVPAAGEAPGTVTAKAASDEFTVESAVYLNDVETWTLGERPEVEVILKAAEGFRFVYTSSDKFRLSGGGADFAKAKIYDGGNKLVLKTYLKRADGKPEEVYGLEWSGSYAMWEAPEEEVKSFEVRLYRNKRLVATVTTADTQYDFRSHIAEGGDYTFRVRAVAKYENRLGSWSDYSEENTFSDYDARYYGQGNWIQGRFGWWYRYYNGDYPASCWKKINQAWYYFNQDGYMLTGWQYIDGHWYYLGNNGVMLGGGWHFINGYWYYLDGSGIMQTGWKNLGGRSYYLNGDGVMLTGWQYINDRWYYLNGDGAMQTGWQNLNGRWYYLNGDGVMMTGWQYVNGYWYYLGGDGAMLTGWQDIHGDWYYLDGNGAMYVNRTTPDGYYVDSSGRRR